MQGLENTPKPGPGHGLLYIAAAAMIWAGAIYALLQPAPPEPAAACVTLKPAASPPLRSAG
jgi:hypothetical protein